MVHRVQIAYIVCVCRDHCRRQVDFGSETIVRLDLHLGLLVFESSPLCPQTHLPRSYPSLSCSLAGPGRLEQYLVRVVGANNVC